MSTDLTVRKFQTIDAVNDYLREHDLNAVDVHFAYFDARSNMHVLWCKTTADTTGSVVNHTTIANGKTAGTDIPVYVMVSGVSEVSESAVPGGPSAATMRLYYRTTGAPGYQGPYGFTRVGDDVFMTEISAGVVAPPSVDYYIEVTDRAGNLTTIGTALLPRQFTVV